MSYFLRTPLPCNYSLFPWQWHQLFLSFIVHRIFFFLWNRKPHCKLSTLVYAWVRFKNKEQTSSNPNNGMKEGSPRQSWLIINQFPVTFQRKTSRGLLSTIFGAAVLALNCSLLKTFTQKRTDPAIPICSHLVLLKILVSVLSWQRKEEITESQE